MLILANSIPYDLPRCAYGLGYTTSAKWILGLGFWLWYNAATNPT
ncbi:hypothetical protein [Helicobacter zhangjianzhongii]|uniref:Uncharacterized protein n=1 Tax=Helicobacter zhangjianzhongii TaxID=2974574 RepID=A0ACC6FQT1_9HELI|nr:MULTISPECIES: hypothetical protein [unclassified Helicobacter]MDL0079478.1 hypothetical protein [Helicobacter sp. CPD2-1]MDL0081621.1 hypothetical protein [Helicobacter sp. XJK30-2]